MRKSLLRILLITLAYAILTNSAYTQTVPLTFKVDMSQENVSIDGVHVAGNFQIAAGFGSNWDPGATPMSNPNGANKYELTVMVPPGTYLYKFVNGNEWSDKPEQPTGDCALSDGGGNFNRQVIVGSQGVTMPIIQFDSCNAILRFSVNMSMESVPAEGVHVMGNFQEAAGFSNNWDPSSIRMLDNNADGIYEIEIQVPPGNYQYLFVNGNTLGGAENPPTVCTSNGDNSSRVRTLTVKVGDAPSLTKCFNSCTTCDPAIDPNYETHWWNDAVFYEIFVRSFYDSNGDGIGDFQGIIQKLDYLNDGDPQTNDDLGITGIWLMPMMESPSYHGYDVTNYYATEPDYGTMADFQALLDAAHSRGIKVIIDFVMNHSSSQHPWFTQSANNQNGFRDWYRWSDNHPGYLGPWGQNVWHQRNGNYYYGLFWDGMPDLNYSNPAVKETLFDVAEFWLDKGVDGFRLDAIKYLDEDDSVLENTPETLQLLEDFHVLYKNANPDAVTVGEVWSNTASILPYIQNDRLDLCFEFDLAYSIIGGINGNSPNPINNQIQTIQASYPRLQYATFLTNHDIDRIFSQFGSNMDKMKLAASLYLTLPGIPFIYYGEEIGMTGTGAHENIRRPMQWSAEAHAGFSTNTPWQALGSNYLSNHVEEQQSDPNSLLRHYQKLVHLRNDHAPLRRGYLLSMEANDDILAYARIYEEEAVILVSNIGNQSLSPSLSMAISSLPPGTYQVTELLSESNWGTLTVNENGGFSNWLPNNTNLLSRDTWALLISQKPVSTSIALETDVDIALFPNPVSQKVNLKWMEVSPINTMVQIFDVNGKKLMEKSFKGQSATLDVSAFSAGVYFLKVWRDGKQKTKRLIVK